MQALGEYLIVRLPDPKKKTEGGIELPEDSKQAFYYGKVESSGGSDANFVCADTYVVFDPQGAVPIQLDPLAAESKIMVLHQEQVFATITIDELRRMGLPVIEEPVPVPT